jgi:sugar lactone lactonase YvrE
MTAAADGSNLIVSTWFGGVTQVYDPWAEELVENYATPVPLNAVRLGGDIAVVELMSGGVVWASTLEPILSIDQEQLFLPAGLATDGDRLWVSDWATGIVWQVEFDGTSPLPPVPIASDLANPEGLAFDYDGGLLVVESSAQRLSRIDLASGAVEVVAEALALGRQADPSGPPTGPVNGVAVGPSGAIYVTGDIGNVLYRIERR